MSPETWNRVRRLHAGTDIELPIDAAEGGIHEQFIYVLKGAVNAKVESEERVVGPGEVIHIPSDALHNVVARTGEDVVYMVAKDTSFGIHGIPEDGKKSGPHYEPGSNSTGQ